MEKQVKELLEQNGFDVEGTMKRFLNNDKLYKQCLGKFLTDESYEKLEKAVAAGNCEEAFRTAHTMKGFVSNLGMNRLYETICPVVEKLRAGDMQITEELNTLDHVYRETCQLIEKI